MRADREFFSYQAVVLSDIFVMAALILKELEGKFNCNPSRVILKDERTIRGLKGYTTDKFGRLQLIINAGFGNTGFSVALDYTSAQNGNPNVVITNSGFTPEDDEEPGVKEENKAEMIMAVSK